MDMIKPNWLAKTFLENLLRKNLYQNKSVYDIHIAKYDITNAVAKGENYMSNIFRIAIEYEVTNLVQNDKKSIHKISLIAKLPLDTGVLLLSVKNSVVEKEWLMYNILLPKIHAIFFDNEENNCISAKSFNHDIEDILILEDLTANGYRLTDRKQPLDFDHVIVLIKQLAKFHAASAKLYDKEREIVKQIGKDSLFLASGNEAKEIKEMYSPIYGETHMELICREFEKWPETRNFKDFMTKLKPKIWDVFCDSLRFDNEEFVVMNHGDVWANNIMYKYDSNSKPNDVKFVDFQFSVLTSPAVDLIRIFYVSIEYDVLKSHYEEFLRIYIDTLNLYLEKFNCAKKLSLNELKKSLEKRDLYCLVQIFNLLPIVIAETKANSENNLSEEKQYIPSHLHENPVFRSICVKYLEDFSKREWFKTFK